MRYLFSATDNLQQSYNLKLSFYFNSLFSSNNNNNNNNNNLTTQLNKNDKEILSHLNQLLSTVGFNYKAELTAAVANSNTIDVDSLHSSAASMINSNENLKKVYLELTTQFDKEFDREILKIYSRTITMFKRFLQQFDKLTEDLNTYSLNLTNQAVAMHSNVRKIYLQRLKNKRIQVYDVKQKWLHLIENMLHSRFMWCDQSSLPKFYILDQTEGPNRERRRLKKSHLYIPERFFKPDIRLKLLSEKQPSPLRYLLNNYEDYLQMASVSNAFGMRNQKNVNNESTSPSNIEITASASSDTLNESLDADSIEQLSGGSVGDYMLYHLKNSEVSK
jgi:hypothetical protein